MLSFLNILRSVTTFTCIVGVTFSTSAIASDDAATTGIVAGLGLTAAAGKTTLAAGAGTIEAGVLAADALAQTGGVIAGSVNRVAGNHRVLLVAHDEVVDLGMPSGVLNRIDAVTLLLRRSLNDCKNQPGVTKSIGDLSASTNAEVIRGTPKASDVVAAVATDIGISPITLSADDRLLMNAVLISRSTRPIEPVSTWTKYEAPINARTKGEASHVSFVLPSEARLPAAGGALAARYASMQHAADDLRKVCTSDAAKAALGTEAALETSLNTAPDKASATPLELAEQLAQFTTGDPLVLRVAVEQIGGTAVTRSGILYTLGLPNAATVGAGLVTGFRLVHPTSGELVLVGIVRCAAHQRNIRKVADEIEGNKSGMTCTYIAG